MSESESTCREFLLYWVGLFVVALAAVSTFLEISTLVSSVLSFNRYIPVVYGMLGIPPPPAQPQPITNAATITSNMPFINATAVPNNFGNQQWPPPPYQQYYCANPYIPVAIFTFVLSLLSSLVFVGVGAYMMLNGKKR